MSFLQRIPLPDQHATFLEDALQSRLEPISNVSMIRNMWPKNPSSDLVFRTVDQSTSSTTKHSVLGGRERFFQAVMDALSEDSKQLLDKWDRGLYWYHVAKSACIFGFSSTWLLWFQNTIIFSSSQYFYVTSMLIVWEIWIATAVDHCDILNL